MKINIFLTIISLALAGLLSYFAFDLASEDANATICTIGSLLCFCSTLIPAIGMSYETTRLGTNIRITSVLFFIVFLVSQFCFAGFGVKMPLYIILNGIILIVYLAILYKMQGIKDI